MDIDSKCIGSSCIAYDPRNRMCLADEIPRELGGVCNHPDYLDPDFQKDMLAAYADGYQLLQISRR